MTNYPYVPFQRFDPGQPPERASEAFFRTMHRRRSVRFFSERPVSRETIEWCVRAAGTAPSGANKQPWRFVCVADPTLKRKIREGAEAEEREFYARRATPEWLADLAPLGTDEHKPFIEIAPWVIVVFKLMHDDPPGAAARARQAAHPEARLDAGETSRDAITGGGQVYYVNESVGIATGLLIAAIHQAGLVTLTHTPSPMKFLGELLGRPLHERPYLLLPVGFAADDCLVPDIHRKPLEQIAVFHDQSHGS